MKQEALTGRTIAGKFKIESLVGEGAMGAVYKARQVTLGTTLAIKVLHAHHAGDPMFAARFLREAQAASRVDHPSSMRVVDFGEEPDGLLYIAMEYVQGRTLAQIIEEECPLPVARIVDIACQALAALAVAHDIGVIHRDLKPENIMIQGGKDDEGRTHDIVKVCDFGVAKLLEGGGRAPSVTAEGMVVGTPEYMSPEQARGESLDARSDIYAMGVLLFHMMTGKVPFDSSTAFGTAFMHVNDEPTRPRLLNPGADSRLEAICLKAMRKRRDDRHASARELRFELRALLGHDDAYMDEVSLARVPMPAAPLAGGLLKQIEARPPRTGLVMAGVVLAASVVAGGILYPRKAPVASHEPVQSARVTSAVMSASPSPRPAAELGEPSKVVDTTAPGGPGSDAVATAAHPRGVTRVSAHARRSGAKTRSEGVPGMDDIPLLPEPGAAAVPVAATEKIAPAVPVTAPVPVAATEKIAPADKATPDAPASADKPAITAPVASDKAAADKPAADKPAAEGAAAGNAAADKRKAAPRPAAKPGAQKPGAARPDPADAPLPNFPIPSVDP